jgi:drug/metabolite transporter (DMT)-like permease
VIIAETRAPARWKADGALALAALIWGTTFVAVKGAVRDMSTMYFLGVRFTFGAICMALLFSKPLRSVSRRHFLGGLRGGLVAGIFLWAGYAFQTNGLRYTTAGNSGFLTGLYIVLVPLFSAALYRKWPRRAELVGVGLAGAGMLVLELPSLQEGVSLNRGDLLTLGCAVCYAGHLMTVGYFSQREHFESVAFGQVVGVAVFAWVGLLFEPPAAHWNTALVLAIVGTGLFATAFTFALQTWGQQYTTSTRAALIFALEPVFALITAVSVGGEALTRYSVSGGCLILGGILLVELRSAPEPRL